MSLKGKTVRIIISEPSDCDKGNLFGTIIQERHNTDLIVELSNLVDYKGFKSNTIQMIPKNDNETFRQLLNNNAGNFKGSFINDLGKSNDLLSGIISID
jgi:hypothetical protein